MKDELEYLESEIVAHEKQILRLIDRRNKLKNILATLTKLNSDNDVPKRMSRAWATEDRKAVLTAKWCTHTHIDDIKAEMEALPGEPVPDGLVIGRYATTVMGLARPVGFTGRRPKATDDPFDKAVVAFVPKLQRYAASLGPSRVSASDLAQQTVMRALAGRDSYTPDTNLGAWLFTILRNERLTLNRKIRLEVEDPDGKIAAEVGFSATQNKSIETAEVMDHLDKLPKEQRDAIKMVSVDGVTYEDAAELEQCAVGTIKSRVSRGRDVLNASLDRTIT